jgi:hypothetical protein
MWCLTATSTDLDRILRATLVFIASTAASNDSKPGPSGGQDRMLPYFDRMQRPVSSPKASLPSTDSKPQAVHSRMIV